MAQNISNTHEKELAKYVEQIKVMTELKNQEIKDLKNEIILNEKHFKSVLNKQKEKEPINEFKNAVDDIHKMMQTGILPDVLKSKKEKVDFNNDSLMDRIINTGKKKQTKTVFENTINFLSEKETGIVCL